VFVRVLRTASKDRAGLAQEILQRDAVAAHQQGALRLERLHEGSRARMGLRRAAALHLDGGQPRPAFTTKSTSWLRSRQ
jgi:hypothetical protein